MAEHLESDGFATGSRGDAVKTVNLALQGGGANGAFAWGALDRLLEEDAVVIEGISATSAGAMNAAVLAYGLTAGGARARGRPSTRSGAGSPRRHCSVLSS